MWHEFSFSLTCPDCLGQNYLDNVQQSHEVIYDVEYDADFEINTPVKQPAFPFIFLPCTCQTICRPYGATGILPSKTGAFFLIF